MIHRQCNKILLTGMACFVVKYLNLKELDSQLELSLDECEINEISCELRMNDLTHERRLQL